MPATVDIIGEMKTKNDEALDSFCAFDNGVTKAWLVEMASKKSTIMLYAAHDDSLVGILVATRKRGGIRIDRVRVSNWLTSNPTVLLFKKLATFAGSGKIVIDVGHEHDRCHCFLKRMGYWGSVKDDHTYRFTLNGDKP
jgi:hypothetical protein